MGGFRRSVYRHIFENKALPARYLSSLNFAHSNPTEDTAQGNAHKCVYVYVQEAIVVRAGRQSLICQHRYIRLRRGLSGLHIRL